MVFSGKDGARFEVDELVLSKRDVLEVRRRGYYQRGNRNPVLEVRRYRT
jgi:hypothetical protein